MRFARLAALACLAFAAGAAEIRLEQGRFLVRGWPFTLASAPREFFAVYIEGGPAGTPVLGSYELRGDVMTFTPRFPPQPGAVYRAVLRTQPPVIVNLKAPPAQPREPAKIEAIYPSGEQIPENQLKLYLHFSQPMGRGDAYSHIRLLDEKSSAIELPFLELEQELWDRSGKRLTLLFDPGRIKRGLVPNQEVGLALQAGHRVTLSVAAGWRDAQGAATFPGFKKEYSVGPADRTPLDPVRWRISTPRLGSSGPLIVDFGEAMDQALAQTLIRVERPAGTGVDGESAVEAHETRWRFTPKSPWGAGAYSLAVDTALEDLAGNRIGRPFDVDVFERVERQVRREWRRIRFEVR